VWIAVAKQSRRYSLLESSDHMVLEYNLLLSTDTTVDLVIGQADFQSIICDFNPPPQPCASSRGGAGGRYGGRWSKASGPTLVVRLG
jgi:hypothetical protein